MTPHRRRGLTLVESLIAITAVVALTTLTLVYVRPVRAAASDTRNLSNLRLTMTDFGLWSADRQELMVNSGLPGTPGANIFPSMPAEWAYLAQIMSWPKVLERDFHTTHEYWQSTNGPLTASGKPPPENTPQEYINTWDSRFLYPHPLRVRAEVYTIPGQRYRSVEEFSKQFVLVSQPMITRPAAKGVLVDRERGGALPWHVAFADGRVAAVNPADGVPAAHIPLFLGEGAPSMQGAPVLETLDGYRGADFN